MNLFEVVNQVEKDNFKIQNAQIAIWRENNNWEAEVFYLPSFSSQVCFSEAAVKNDFNRLEEIIKIDPEAILVFGYELITSAWRDVDRKFRELNIRDDDLKYQEFFNDGILEYLKFNYGSDRGDEIWKYLKWNK